MGKLRICHVFVKDLGFFLIEQISLLGIGMFRGFFYVSLSPLVVFYGEHIVSIQQGL